MNDSVSAAAQLYACRCRQNAATEALLCLIHDLIALG